VAASKAKLRKLLLRYYPPGIILEYEHDGELMQRSVDLLDLSPETDAERLLDAIFARESMLRPSHREPLRALLAKLQTKLSDARHADFELFKVLRAHILPLTNCAFNKNGDAFVTGSYDRTCKVWDTASGEETHTLEGHKNVVYAVAFNNPFGDKVITGSFDKTCKLWDARTGELFYTLRGHETEIVCLGFDPSSTAIATGSMDASARLWDVETGRETCALRGHTAEIVSLSFSTSGNTLLTGSFDHDCRLWDARAGSCVRVLEGHRAEISAARFDFASGAAASGSMDRGVRLWDLGERQGDVRLAGPLGRGPGRVLRRGRAQGGQRRRGRDGARVRRRVGRVRARARRAPRGDFQGFLQPARHAGAHGVERRDVQAVGRARGDVRADPGGAHGRDLLVRVQLPGGQDHHREQGQHVQDMDVRVRVREKRVGCLLFIVSTRRRTRYDDESARRERTIRGESRRS
jgi:dynein assembly factor with WDR repeat domains 1